MPHLVCKNTFISDSGYSYLQGEYITLYEFQRLTPTERTYFTQPDNLDFSLRDKEKDYEGQDPEYYDD